MWQTLAENPEHVPLLVTPPAAASKHQKPSATATTIDIPNNASNGNGLIVEHSDQHRPLPLSPVFLSNSSSAHVMRSRLNQYKVSGNNLVVNYDGDNGTTAISTTKASSRTKKKKKAVDI